MTARKQIKLNAFLHPSGHHVASWRHPQAQADAGVNFRHYVELAQKAEAAKFDALFLADTVAMLEGSAEARSRSARYTAQFEPLTLLSGLAAVTERIGLIATASTTYNEPFHVARKFASLDLISEGRAGWNLVTSATRAEAQNFNRDTHLDHARRYERAREFASVVTGLWNSFEDDALPRDKVSGRFFDPAKVHELDHRGTHFSVRGPLNVARSPQGRPVIVQAGSSGPGKTLAAETADVVFTAQQTLDEAVAFYREIKALAVAAGRSPDDVKIMPGVSVFVGRTEAEAQDKFEQLQRLIHPSVGLQLLSGMIGFDLTGHDLDGPLPELPETNDQKGRQALTVAIARRENLTIRGLYEWIAGARGHWTLIGSAENIADQLEERFEAGGADGYNVMPPHLPAGLDDFIGLVLPELRRRGLFRREYEGRTLRENLGLPYPHHPAAALRQAAE